MNNLPPISEAWDKGEKNWEVSFLSVYPITMFLGVLCAFLSVAYFWKRQKYSWEILQVLLIIIVPSSIVGARLWYLISEGGWNQWYHLQGLSIHGGVMGALLCAVPYIYSRRHAIDMRTTLGIIMPSVILGQAIGRWGNFANHEVFGAIVDGDSLNWMGAMKSHMYISVNGEAAYRAPFFFYEFMTSAVGYIFMVLILLRKNWVKPGVTAAIYLLWYGIVRIAMEPYRDESDIMRWGSMSISVFIAALSIVIGALSIIWLQFGIPKKMDRKYDLIQPIKERRIFFFGPKVDWKYKYLFFGEKVPNKVRIWLPNDEQEKWSKRRINSQVFK